MFKEKVIKRDSRGNQELKIQAFNPVTGKNIPDLFTITSSEEIDKIICRAEEAFQKYRKISFIKRAKFLEHIGMEIMKLGDKLIKKCMDETGLPEARIIGERARTVNQLNLFAQLLKDGFWLNARIDTALTTRLPQPKPDIRQTQMPIGPVGVFEASNFPLAFSTAGGDTASALAAGCTVIAKSHSGHPGTSARIAEAIDKAVKATGMPEGTFTLVHGSGKEVGMSIVNHPLVKAIGFTGSFLAGKVIFDAANKREEPIPVFAEMGSINPVFVLPEAMEKEVGIPSKLVDSIVLGTGQFCTNPGLVIMSDSDGADMFREEVKKKISTVQESTMLSPRIKQSYDEGVSRFPKVPGVKKLAQGKGEGAKCQGLPQVFETSFQSFMKNKILSEEVFGPSSLLVTTKNKGEVVEIAKALKGHLTITVFGTQNDLVKYSDLISILETKAGRLIVNGVPTGVEVCHAVVHGGPFPATTDGKSTSVGTTAIYRFTRPVCYQDFIDDFLPDELKNKNPLGFTRLVNGKLTTESL